MAIIRDQISSVFDMDIKRVDLYFKKTDKFYRSVEIPKKRGGSRKIYLPSPEIKMFQHYISEKFLSKVKTSTNATAYTKNKSIIDNVSPHLVNEHFLFTDISNFFDAIDLDIMISILKQEITNLDLDDIADIVRICTYQGKFVQGAVTSPIISNIYLSSFDKKIHKIVSDLKDGKYTRYSDDITISSSEIIPATLIETIKVSLNEYKLQMNMEKTYFSSYLPEIEVTGLKINNGSIQISNAKKRYIRNMIYHKLKKGKDSKETANQVLGYLFYLMNVDPNYYNILNLKYSKKKNMLVKRLLDIAKSEKEVQP